ncbi:MAG: hypothetical protein PHY28_04380 [Dehalococcoidales bacterium]|nr:hypothetical protein [Dehalococcoidales bacterium]
MLNNQQYFFRVHDPRFKLNWNSERRYPSEVFPFGSPDIELFAHLTGETWYVTEKKTGTKISEGPDMDTAVKNAKEVIRAYGDEKFISLIKDVLQKFKDGWDYDYGTKEWSDPNAVKIMEPEAPVGADE